jgi:hydroxymethylpyrimidine/phosphomethylpyrimidine kinase
MTPRILVVAGSDSGGGAGIQADIKTITMLGGHATTAITAITAQNTLGVQRVFPLPVDLVADQFRSIVDDIGVDAVKIGMLGRPDLVEAVGDLLAGLPDGVPIVFDPVMVATSGDMLMERGTAEAMHRLLDLATLATPNLPELAVLGGEAAVLAHACALLVKGGHGDGAMIVDRLIERDGGETRWEAPRIDTRHTHGTGCTLASAIAEGLGRGLPLADAVGRARRFVRLALHEAPGLGAGHGPMGHGRVRLDGLGDGACVNQVTLPLDDMAGSAAFYRLIGLRPIVASGDRYARFESDGGVTVSIEARAELPAGAPVVFVECADLDAAVARVRAAGVAIDGPLDRSWGWREARLVDPAGNPLCLYQAGEMRRFPPWRLSHAQAQAQAPDA